MTNLWPPDLLQALLSATNLDGIHSVNILLLDLNDLAPVDLDDGARSMDTPSVPEVCHANLVAENADSPRMAVHRLGCLQLVKARDGIHLVLKRPEGARLMLLWPVGRVLRQLLIVNDLRELKVLPSHLMQGRNRERLRYWLCRKGAHRQEEVATANRGPIRV